MLGEKQSVSKSIIKFSLLNLLMSIGNVNKGNANKGAKRVED